MNNKHVWFEGDDQDNLGSKNSECGNTSVQEVVQYWACENDDRIVLVEVCCNSDSVLGSRARSETWVIRITESCDIMSDDCRNKMQEILQTCNSKRLFIWISAPRTTGCTWHRTNPAVQDRPEFQKKVSEHAKIATRALEFAQWANQLGHQLAWEWPAYNDL
eukprot:3783721-Amphidinium_carterae.4